MHWEFIRHIYCESIYRVVQCIDLEETKNFLNEYGFKTTLDTKESQCIRYDTDFGWHISFGKGVFIAQSFYFNKPDGYLYVLSAEQINASYEPYLVRNWRPWAVLCSIDG